MRKTLLLFMTVMFAVSMSAQKHVLRVWRGGEKLFETKIEENDSITFTKLQGQDYSYELPDTFKTFTYEDWRKQEEIYLFIIEGSGGRWYPTSLPWRASSTTAIFDEYRKPNKEFCINENNDTIPRWELAFNTCYDYSLRGVHMFGLWDSKSQIMRIYSYVETRPNPNAKYCFYEVSSTDTVLIDRDNKMWHPSDSLLRAANWSNKAIPNDTLRPSGKSCRVLPITGALQNGQINGGTWLCFELNFGSKDFDIHSDESITFNLTGVQEVDFNADGHIGGWLRGRNGNITLPGSEYRMASGILKAVGTLGSDISSTTANTVTAGSTWGYLAGIAGVIGTAATFAGNMMDAIAENDDLKYNLALDFHADETLGFNGQMCSTLSTTTGNTITMSYGEFFKEVLKNNPPKKQASRRRANSNGDDVISLGVWNLKKQPVLYVCNDARYFSEHELLNIYTNYGTLASFLDPTSIELLLNTKSTLFDIENVKKVSLVAYDFAFVNEKYTMDAQQYYGFYGVPQDKITNYWQYWRLPWGEAGEKMCLLDQDAEYQSSTKDGIKYTGVKGGFPASDGYDLSQYDVIYSPAIQTNSDKLNTVGVSVIVEIEFKDGDRRVFAERFLPQIKTFNMADAPALKRRLENATVPTSIDGIELENKLFDKQKAKALRMLEPLAYAASGPYPIVNVTENTENVHWRLNNWLPMCGIRIRDYQREGNIPGIVITTFKGDQPYEATDLDDINTLREYLQNLNDWDTINSKLERCGMYSLNNNYIINNIGSGSWGGINIQTGEKYKWYGNVGIRIYEEWIDGSLTQW